VYWSRWAAAGEKPAAAVSIFNLTSSARPRPDNGAGQLDGQR